MKKFTKIILLVNLIIMSSCEKHTITRVGFNSQINMNSNGTTILYADHNAYELCLKGYISLTEGSVKVELIDSDGVAVYSIILESPNTFEIDETFPASIGYWKLKYSSIEGTGTINLDMDC